MLLTQGAAPGAGRVPDAGRNALQGLAVDRSRSVITNQPRVLHTSAAKWIDTMVNVSAAPNDTVSFSVGES